MSYLKLGMTTSRNVLTKDILGDTIPFSSHLYLKGISFPAGLESDFHGI